MCVNNMRANVHRCCWRGRVTLLVRPAGRQAARPSSCQLQRLRTPRWSPKQLRPRARLDFCLRGSSAPRKQCHQGRSDLLRRELDAGRAMPRTNPTVGSARMGNARHRHIKGRSQRFAAIARHAQVIADQPQGSAEHGPPPRATIHTTTHPRVAASSKEQATAPVSCLRYGVADPPHPVGALWSMESVQ